MERPYATLQRAQQAARQAKGREPVTIYLRGGTHYLTDTLILTAEDSGTPTAPVVYQAYRNEQMVISGGVRLKGLKWAGINIGDGCWGGHVIEFCDIFDTVKETGDHGSFNSWGRDRFWGLDGLNLNDDKVWEAEKDVPLLDAVKTVVIRNNRWRCDHGWDIDLDNGSSNYHIYNNLCLHGGLKNREGFHRVVENNIIVNNGFHPHVWYKHSQDVFRRNIIGSEGYLPAGGMPSTPWGKEMDYNLVHRPGVAPPKPAAGLARQSQRDAHSIVADAMFVDPASGDFRVKPQSPALQLGFVNFPMDQFGVRKPELKAIARTPQMPDQVVPAARAGLQKDDVILACNGKPVRTVEDLGQIRDDAAGKKLMLSVMRKQQLLSAGTPHFGTFH